MPDAAPTSDHFCQLPEPSLNMADQYSRGRSYQCPECHAEWLVVTGGEPEIARWMMHVSAEQAAAQVEALMHELAHEDIDPAVINALMDCAGHAVERVVNTVIASHGPASGEVLRRAWNLFAQCVQPYFLAEPCKHHTHDGG